MAGPQVGKAIGIDLGTTYCCVAAFDDDTIETIEDELGLRTMASELAFKDNGACVIGNAACATECKSQNFIYDSKRMIGRKFNDKTVQDDIKTWEFVVAGVNGEPNVKIEINKETVFYSPEQISSKLLLKLKERAERRLGAAVTHAVVTIPEYFDISQRRATMDAAKLAGLEVLRLMSEPCAAAMAYIYKKRNHYDTKKNILVYDLGGGTFDVSVLTVDGGSLEVLSTNGNTHLGGQDFTNRLLNYVIAEFKSKKVTINDHVKKELRAKCERVKRQLTSSIMETIKCGDAIVEVSRACFDHLNIDLFESTAKTIEQALDYAHLRKSDIDEVILTGGSTRILKVEEIVKTYFDGKELNNTVNVDEAVAHGAAIQAAILVGDTSEKLKGITLIDVTPLSLGIETGFGDMTTVVKRNTRIPLTRSHKFTTRNDYQITAKFSVYEGERAQTKDNNLLGSFLLENIPPALRGVPSLVAVFDMDSNGILTVTATETGAGNCGKITIKQEGRMNAVQIDECLLIAKQAKDADDEARTRQVARNDLEAYVYQVKRKIEGTAMNNATERKLNKCIDILNWLKASELSAKNVYEGKKEELDNVK